MTKKEADWSEDDLRFDRLVDGELSAAEYRQLLSSLDDEPGGWRRCAMAFLEAQALGQELRALRHSAELPLVSHSPPAEWSPPRWTGWLAMAASLLLMFALGAVVPRIWRGETDVAPRVTRYSPPREGNLVAPSLHADVEPMGQLDMFVSDESGGATQPIHVPVYDARRNPRWNSEQDSAIPDELVQSLERNGYQVERHDQLVPVELEDGSQAVIPVEGFEIVLAGRRPF